MPAVIFLSSMPVDVVERLERRARLAVALADDVVLGLELGLGRRRVVVRRCRRRRRARRSGSRARRARRCGGPCSCRFAIHGSSFLKPSALAAAVGFLACGTMAAALTHFSAIFWRPTSRVVVTRRPPRSRLSHVSASAPQSLVGQLVADRPDEVRRDPVRRRPGCARTTGSCLAALKSAGVYWSPDIGRPAAVGEQVEDLVPALDDRGVGRDDELRLPGQSRRPRRRRSCTARCALRTRS